MTSTEQFADILALLSTGDPFEEEKGGVLLHEFATDLLREHIGLPNWPGSDVQVPLAFITLLSDALDTVDGYESRDLDE